MYNDVTKEFVFPWIIKHNIGTDVLKIKNIRICRIFKV